MKALIVLAVLVPSLAAAQERSEEGGFLIERDNVQIKPHASVKVKEVQIDNRLGDVTVIGHDDPAVILHVFKRGPDGDTLDRLKVNLNVDPDGTISIAGALLAGQETRPLPARSVRIDVTVEMPRDAHIDVHAWNGKIAVTGVRAGAKLSAHEADIAVTDVAGAVETGATRGSQRLTGVRGTVTTDHTYGEVSLESVSGDSLAAKVHDGRLVATRIKSRRVKLRTTFGDIHFTGEVLAGGRYDLASYRGDVIVDVVPMQRGPRLDVEAWTRDGQVESRFDLAAGASVETTRLKGSFGASKGKPAVLMVSSRVGDVRLGLLNE